MQPKIVVIGGTGSFGTRVVDKLKQSGNDAVAASTGTGVFTSTREGSDGLLADADIVVDVASAPSLEDQAAWDFFQTVDENLAVAEVADAINFFRTAHENLSAAVVAARVKHHVALSVVGTDRLQDLAYFRMKMDQENKIRGSDVPHTIVRGAYLFEWIRPMAQAGADGDVVRVPHALFQPVAAGDVAIAVAELALEPPRNGTVEIAGPDVFYIDELVARVLEHDKDPRTVVRGDPEGRFFGIKLEDDSLMPGREVRLGPTSFDSWLTQNPSPRTS